VSGYDKGDVWSDWVTPAGATIGHIKVQFNSDGTNCAPGTGCHGTCTGWNYTGFAMREYEYRRYQAGAVPVFPPFRFPGQYYDPETDLNENWHRYYSPEVGRYLEPEPKIARSSTPRPMYAYAASNPLRYVDWDGLFVIPIGADATSTVQTAIAHDPTFVATYAYLDSLPDLFFIDQFRGDGPAYLGGETIPGKSYAGAHVYTWNAGNCEGENNVKHELMLHVAGYAFRKYGAKGVPPELLPWLALTSSAGGMQDRSAHHNFDVAMQHDL
jgi:RHS repeat-associated protein